MSNFINNESSASSGTVAEPDSEEEDQDESSSSEKEVELALYSFRERWKKELQISKCNQPKHVEKHVHTIAEQEDDIESRAKALFLKGNEMEKSGKLYEAIQFYRRAVQLVPDIEFKLDELSKFKHRENLEMDNVKEDVDIDVDLEEDESCSDDRCNEDEIKEGELLAHIQKKINKMPCICIPKFEQTATHFSALPMEIILYILKWIVSSDLDLRSLEVCSMISRGFYLFCRDPEIWRLACERTWGINCGSLPNTYTSWRQMYIDRARLLFNGCYISKTTYIRHGENSFQDQFYRPWHLIAYYRYLRFFPEGLVLMLTTADEPIQCINLLKCRTAKTPSVLTGHYRLKDDKVTLVVQRRETIKQIRRTRRRDTFQDNVEQTFNLELQIRNYKSQKHVQLIWTGYSVFNRNGNGTESKCTFDLLNNRFPPLWFSRVKSYTAESNDPLQ